MFSDTVPVERGERYWIAGIANAALMEKNSMEFNLLNAAKFLKSNKTTDKKI